MTLHCNRDDTVLSREGVPVARFGPTDSVVPTVEAEIEKLL